MCVICVEWTSMNPAYSFSDIRMLYSVLNLRTVQGNHWLNTWSKKTIRIKSSWTFQNQTTEKYLDFTFSSYVLSPVCLQWMPRSFCTLILILHNKQYLIFSPSVQQRTETSMQKPWEIQGLLYHLKMVYVHGVYVPMHGEFGAWETMPWSTLRPFHWVLDSLRGKIYFS